MKKKRWKVVSIYNGGYCSAIAVKRKFTVDYHVGKWAIAQKYMAKAGYHLTVFNRLQSARIFVETSAPRRGVIYEIWQCEAKRQVDLPPMVAFNDLDDYCFVPISEPHWPGGTEMFKRVKLVTRISTHAQTSGMADIIR